MNTRTLAGALALGITLITAGPASAAPPANDNFANAATLSVASGAPAFANATNVDATREAGEPDTNGDSTVWFKWQADQTETIAIDTCGSDFNTVLAVYTGTQVNNLSLKAASDNDGCGSVTSLVVLGVSAGQNYRISVGGVDSGAHGPEGDIDLNISEHAPVVSLEPEVKVTEQNSGTSNAVFDVTLSEPVASEVTAYVETYDNTAFAGEDFTDIGKWVTFAAGDMAETVTVPVVGDTYPELQEQFTAYLWAVDGGGAEDGNQFGTGIILNDDGPPPSLSIEDLEATEGDSGTTTLDFTVSMTNPVPGKGASVYFGTHDGSADYYSQDYVWKEGALSFSPGETEEHVSVVVKGDQFYEQDEKFTVELTAGAGATVDDAVGEATILNDDEQPMVSIAPASADEGGEMTFTVTMTGDQIEDSAAVHYEGVDGLFGAAGATRSDDYYVNDSGWLSFEPGGERTKTVTVDALDDLLDEPDEQFVIRLTSDDIAFGQAEATGTIIDNDPTPEVKSPPPPPPAGRCVVPSLKGKRLAGAKSALAKARCSIGKVSRKKAKRRKPGRVIRQSRVAGTTLPAGSAVNVVLSKRPSKASVR